MAKSRKSKKTTDPAKQSVEAEKNALPTEAMPEDLDAAVPGADKSDDVVDGEIVSTEADSPDETEMSVEQALEATDKEVFDSDAANETASESADDQAEPAAADADASELSYEKALEATDAEIFDDSADAEVAEEKETEAASPVEEPVTEAADEPKPEPKAANASVPPAQQKSSGGMWPAVFGGLIAALLGFIAGRGDQLDQYLPASMQRGTVDLTALEAEAAQLAEQTTTQQARIDTLEAAVEATRAAVEATPETVAVDNSEEITALEQTIAALTDRLAAVESRPVVDVDAAPSEVVESLQAALDAQNAQIAELAERAADAEAQAAGEAARLLARAALTRVVTAVDSGQSFAPALSDLEDVTPVEVPEPLRAAAEAGVPTLAALQESFPDAARAGLAAARSDVPESEGAGITDFLKRQLNVRSVIPRDGADADAVLSRVQAAVRSGDLDTVLAEIGSLPESARTAMSDWVEAAEARKAAQDAANDLADSLNSN